MTAVRRAGSADDVDFRDWVKPGDLVAWTQGAGEPVALVRRLLAQRHDIGPFRALLGTTYSNVIRAEHADVISFLGFGVVGVGKELAEAGVLDIVPVNLSEVPRLLRSGRIRVDVLLMQVSDRRGSYSLGAVNGYVHEAIDVARSVIVEVNSNAPWTFSRTVLDPQRISLAVPSDLPLVETAERPPTDIDEVIGRQIAELVPDEAVLQIGIGGVPSAVAGHLGDHRRLGLHSGVVGDSVLGLLRCGVIDNSRKPVDTGISVAGLLAGSRDLYSFAHENPALRVEPVSYTHDPRVLRQMPRFTAVNSALEVDLTGQVGAEVIGGRFVGTIGGQADFLRAALASDQGRSFIGLPARTRRSRQSRIVPVLRSGVVSTPRAEADVIVTEHGIARLRGKTVRERVEQMIAIAHPDDREALERDARSLVAGLASGSA